MSQHHPLPGYGQPPNQPYPAAPPPGGPPASGRQLTVPLWAVIVAGVAGLCVVGGGIAVAVALATDGGPDGERAAVASPTPAPATSGPPEPATSAPPDPDELAGPPRLPVGEGAENDTGRLTVTDAQRFTEPDSRLGEPPENDVFLQVTVHAEAVGEEVYAISAYDFYVRDSNGRQYDYGGGHSTFAITEHGLSITELNPGEQVTGDIAFDVPTGELELVFAPDYGRSQVIWEIP